MKAIAAIESDPGEQRRRTVFVIDDNPLVRKVVCTILENEGLHVVSADGPVKALELAEQFDVAPDLMLCDICMPLMSGPELYERVAMRFPSQPVLFMSGYPAEHLEQSGTVITEELLLRKPFRGAELVARVGQLLR